MLSKKTNQKNDISGILLLDKPLGISSNGALQKCKRLFNAKKAGHTGSLDPLASGLLPILFGKSTKLAQSLLDSDKCYTVKAKLGVMTSTGDAEGEIISQLPVPPYSMEQLQETLAQFRGVISQVPPMYSALKHKGQPLYQLARQGIIIEREARQITIHDLQLLAYEPTETFSLSVRCTKGTYIRTLVEDIGHALGCGASVLELRRTGVAGFNETQMVTIAELENFAELGKEKLYSLLLSKAVNP